MICRQTIIRIMGDGLPGRRSPISNRPHPNPSPNAGTIDNHALPDCLPILYNRSIRKIQDGRRTNTMNRRELVLLLAGMLPGGCRKAEVVRIVPTPAPTATPTPVPVRAAETLDLTPWANRSHESPWADRPADGYRAWRPEAVIGGIPFKTPSSGQILSLAPGESVELTLPRPVPARELALLCSAALPTSEPLTFFVEVETTNHAYAIPFLAHDWELGSVAETADATQPLAALSQGREITARLEAVSAEIYGEVVRLRIRNNRALQGEALLIAAVTLLP
jgi:hypothetical protein